MESLRANTAGELLFYTIWDNFGAGHNLISTESLRDQEALPP
jgi:hypothetical protein